MLGASMPIRNVADRQKMLDEREREREERLSRVAIAMRKSQDPPAYDDDDNMRGTSCLCFRFARTRLRNDAADATADAAANEAMGNKLSNGKITWWQRMFNRQVQQSNRLDQASKLLSERMDNLEARTKAAREEAKLRMQHGQKEAAMRALKRSKMLEASQKQAAAAAAALDRQRELFAEAALQKEVSGVIASTIKSMKSSCKPSAITSAERAMDDAQEVQDGITDLGDVMAQFGASGLASVGADDDDALLEELNAMVDADDEVTREVALSLPVPPNAAGTTAKTFTAAALPKVPLGALSKEERDATATNMDMSM